MNLFKKKEKKECCCSQIDQESIIKAEESKKEDGIRILGSGCKKCEKVCKFDAVKVEDNLAMIDPEKCN